MEVTIAKSLLNTSLRESEMAEVVMSSGCQRGIVFENNKLKKVGAAYSESIGLRVIKAGKVGVAATNDLRKVSQLVGKAVDVSGFGPLAQFEFPGKSKFGDVKTCSSSLLKFSNKDLVKLGEEMVNEFQEFDSKLLCFIEFNISQGESIILNSSGLEIANDSTRFGFGVYTDLVRAGDMLVVEEGQASCKADIDFVFYLDRLKQKINNARTVVKIKSGQYPVVFTPSSLGTILAYLYTALSGKNVVKGSSRLQGQLGKEVFDPRLTIIDDGLIDWKTGSTCVDAEGVPVGKLSLIQQGIVSNYYYDLQSAAQAGVASTGHGSRGLTSALGHPGLHNIQANAGEEAYVSILSGIEQGILAEEFIGMGQDNPFNGDFSLNLNLGYKIEKGKIVGRVKDTMIAGNAFELLAKGIRAISKEREWVGGSALYPYVVLEPVSVVSKGDTIN
ncbi:TldD/PmbA family protein [Patescibacteria group bacterium]|nr:TldD/PmbA family protein [Patescibacteria group bacterium]